MFIIIGTQDVGGFERAYEISKYLRILSLKMCDILVDCARVCYEYNYFFM
jgi:hypothetical protein